MQYSSAVVGTILLGLVSCAVTYNQLSGVWTTGDQAAGCRTDLQFSRTNYLAYYTGENCDLVGAYLGTYSIAGDVVFVQLAQTIEGTVISFNSFVVSVNENELLLYSLNEALEKGDLLLNVTKATENSFDGVYSAILGPFTVRTQFDSGLYLSYTILNEDLTTTLPYLGTMGTSKNDPAKFTLYFADFAPGAVAGGKTPSDKVTYENIEVTPIDDNSMYFYLEDPPNSATLEYALRAKDEFEGLWAAYSEDSGCYTTVEFSTGLYRSYNVGGLSCGNHATLGVYNVLDSTTIRVAYARVARGGYEALQGTALDMTYHFGAEGTAESFLELSGLVPGTSDSFSLNLTRVYIPPEAVLTRFHVEGKFDNFDYIQFVADLSSLTKLRTTNIEFVGTYGENDTFVMSIVLIDDQASQVFAADAFTAVSTLETIGGSHKVISISAVAGLGNDVVTTPAPTAAPTTEAPTTEAPTNSTTAPTVAPTAAPTVAPTAGGAPAGNAAVSSFQIGFTTLVFVMIAILSA